MRRAFFAGGVASCVLLGASARAQTPSPEDMASARALGTEGVRLADAGDCASAIPKLEGAEKLYHAPSTLERLGECQINVGRLVAGTENLNRVVREPLAPNAPQAFVSARQRAQQLLGAALPRIGKLRIHVEGAPPETVSVTVDGGPVPSALFDADRPTDPGAHEVKAIAQGFKPTVVTVTLPEGGSAPVDLKLEADLNAPAPVATPGTAAPAPETPPSPAPPEPARLSAGGSHVPAIVAFAVGGAGLVVGSIFGILALDTKSTLDGHDGCVDKVCPSSAQSDIDSLGSQSTIANVGFGIGIVGVAVGAVLLVTSHGGSAEVHARSAPPRAAISARPRLGIGSFALGGTFE